MEKSIWHIGENHHRIYENSYHQNANRVNVILAIPRLTDLKHIIRDLLQLLDTDVIRLDIDAGITQQALDCLPFGIAYV